MRIVNHQPVQQSRYFRSNGGRQTLYFDLKKTEEKVFSFYL